MPTWSMPTSTGNLKTCLTTVKWSHIHILLLPSFAHCRPIVSFLSTLHDYFYIRSTEFSLHCDTTFPSFIIVVIEVPLNLQPVSAESEQAAYEQEELEMEQKWTDADLPMAVDPREPQLGGDLPMV
ncbi:hypothetical protein BGZ90_000686 [Linnemannia elongata]|nr:hypothetical protein BGZ90_000686 [Linnemannia elongata]